MKTLCELSTEQLAALNDEQFINQVITEIEAFHAGGPHLKDEHLALARARSEELVEVIERIWPPPRPEQKAAKPTLTQPPPAGSSVSGKAKSSWRRKLTPEPKAQPRRSTEEDAVKRAAEELKEEPRVKFHKSDLNPEAEPPPTIEEKEAALERLAKLYDSDPLAYAEERIKWAERLCTTREALDKAAKVVRDRESESEQSQATKLVAIGLGSAVRLWHSAQGLGYASIRVAEHWENYRLDSTIFNQWLRTEYGRQYTCKIGEQVVPQAPGNGAVKDAVEQLRGIARTRAQGEPAIRVGGNIEEIWIDLCNADWSAVRVTAEGWSIEKKAKVAFVRTGAMLPLPEPVKGGSVQDLRRALNVRASDFVLCMGWELQALSPEGPYPVLNLHGDPGNGKTQISKILQRIADPNSLGVRRIGRVEDLLIAARNNRVLAFDNVSWISGDISDLFCMLATGIATGKRTNYTDDEEFAFSAMRPAMFNGIGGELTERSDLADRVIKLEIPLVGKRLGPAQLEREFVAMWPSVFGALLDGLSGAIRDWQSIEVEEPARMMDFERWAEAGCRAMGFADWEFVDAYAANRQGSMSQAAEASVVGRAVVAYMKKYPKGFVGTQTELLEKLEHRSFKGDATWRDGWPKDATRLSTKLRQLTKPLAAVGIFVQRGVDRRDEEAGHNKDVIIRYKCSQG